MNSRDLLYLRGSGSKQLLLGRGVHTKMVQKMLQHATVTQTIDTYHHVPHVKQDNAVAAMQNALSREH